MLGDRSIWTWPDFGKNLMGPTQIHHPSLMMADGLAQEYMIKTFQRVRQSRNP